MKIKIASKYWSVFLQSFQLFKKHDTLTLGAALAYYTGFSLIPIIIIVISIAGAILGPEAVRGEITRQLQGFLGKGSAQQLQDVIMVAYKPGKNGIVTTVAIVFLIIGASSVFVQIRTSLNTIWDVKASAKRPVLQFIITRLFSFAMIVCVAFLLLVSLVLHALLAAFSSYLNQRILPNASLVLIWSIDIVLSLGLTSILFALVYKYMSDAKLKWRRVWPGAFFTAILFITGKYLISLYLSTNNIEEAYGAAGALVLFLMWVFYSSQIVFFGAEFTRALATDNGVLLDPEAVKQESKSA